MNEKFNQTMIHPAALAFTLAMGIAICVVRRDRAAIPLLLVACLITNAQRIVLGGLDFPMLRIVVMFGWARVLGRGESKGYRFHRLDHWMVAWLVIGTIIFSFGKRGSMDAFIYRLGVTVDAAGGYFLFRILLRDVRDVSRTIGTFSWIAVGMLGPMLIENLTGNNLFAVLGGVPEHTHIRDGRLRCQASFSHPIMVGNFGASTAALLGALWLAYPKQRLRHSAGLVAATGVTILSNSSGPLMAYITALIGWAMWPLRRKMRSFRWCTVGLLFVLHFIREKPVWHLIARLSTITGGEGYHRYVLIDEFIIRFREWWLLGSVSAHWRGAVSNDITNQYILEGVRGGLATLVSFIGVLVVAFRTVGQTVGRALSESYAGPRRETALLAWGLGVCLAAHSMAFIGVSYFGQLQSILYLHLAMIPSLAEAVSRRTHPAADAKAASKRGTAGEPARAMPGPNTAPPVAAIMRSTHRR